MKPVTIKTYLYALILGGEVAYIGQTITPYSRRKSHERKYEEAVFVILFSGTDRQVSGMKRDFIKNLKAQGFCKLNKAFPKNPLIRSRNKGIPVAVLGKQYPSKTEAARTLGVCMATIYNLHQGDNRKTMKTILELLQKDEQAKVVCGTRALYCDDKGNFQVWAYNRGRAGVMILETSSEAEAVQVVSIG